MTLLRFPRHWNAATETIKSQSQNFKLHIDVRLSFVKLFSPMSNRSTEECKSGGGLSNLFLFIINLQRLVKFVKPCGILPVRLLLDMFSTTRELAY